MRRSSGAQFRHPLPDVNPALSLILVWLKVSIAAFIVTAVVYLLVVAPGQLREARPLVRRTKLLAFLYCLQLTLAVCTWVSNFGWPKWFADNITTIKYTVVENGGLQVWATTAHAAVGSLCFVCGVNVAMWSYRLLETDPNTLPSPIGRSAQRIPSSEGR